MPTKEEKVAFAQRLQMALRAACVSNNKAIKGAADLARQFNLKHSGERGISVQAAHKWLRGQVIPTADKIKTLAEWLGVGEHWLHYGPPPESKALEIKLTSSLPVSTLIKKIKLLSTHQRYLIEELVMQIAAITPTEIQRREVD